MRFLDRAFLVAFLAAIPVKWLLTGSLDGWSVATVIALGVAAFARLAFRRLGLPPASPDEAYLRTLRRSRRERAATAEPAKPSLPL